MASVCASVSPLHGPRTGLTLATCKSSPALLDARSIRPPARPTLINLLQDALGILDCFSDSAFSRWTRLVAYLVKLPCCGDCCGKKELHIAAARPLIRSSGNGTSGLTHNSREIHPSGNAGVHLIDLWHQTGATLLVIEMTGR